ncbi:MAG: hypothetical protein IJB83_02485 [Bacilli bacterium]|nr:hypothetical protein [Bacilli bacterium]
MNEEEVIKIMQRIKNNFSQFRSAEQNVIEEWCKRLKDYDFDEVMRELESYFEYATEPPLISTLTQNLKKKTEPKEPTGIFMCNRCRKRFRSIKEADECEERDKSLKYIIKMCDVFDINPNEYFKPYATRCSLKEINDNYETFMRRVCKEQQKNPKLHGLELEGLRMYYREVLAK